MFLDNRWLPRQSIPSTLHGVALKLDRAERHIDEIVAIVHDVLAGHAAAVAEDRREGNRVVYRLRGAPAVPAELSAIFGDALHNMRSALDHLAWQLVLLNSGHPTNRTQFPLLHRRPTDGALPNIEGGVSHDARVLLDQVQPYTWTDDDPEGDPRIAPLAVLAHLSNVDKHRELLLGVAVVSSGSWSNDIGETAYFERGPHRSVQDGDELGSLVVDPPEVQVHDLQLEFALRLLEDSQAGIYARFDLVDWALQHALRAVEYRVMRRFLPLFV